MLDRGLPGRLTPGASPGPPLQSQPRHPPATLLTPSHIRWVHPRPPMSRLRRSGRCGIRCRSVRYSIVRTALLYFSPALGRVPDGDAIRGRCIATQGAADARCPRRRPQGHIPRRSFSMHGGLCKPSSEGRPTRIRSRQGLPQAPPNGLRSLPGGALRCVLAATRFATWPDEVAVPNFPDERPRRVVLDRQLLRSIGPNDDQPAGLLHGERSPWGPELGQRRCDVPGGLSIATKNQRSAVEGVQSRVKLSRQHPDIVSEPQRRRANPRVSVNWAAMGQQQVAG